LRLQVLENQEASMAKSKQELLDQRHSIERDILRYLKEHGPTPFQTLYSLFDRNHTGRANAAIADLRLGNLYMKVDTRTEMATITDAGLERLADGKF
jgi:beta-lactamase superfamily II metal-dependent hydrolase